MAWGVLLTINVPLAAQQHDQLRSADRQAWQAMVSKGIAYLESKGQATDGSFSSAAGPGADVPRHYGSAAARPIAGQSCGGERD